VRLLCCASTVGAGGGGGGGVRVSVGNGDKEKADSFNCGCKSAVVMLNARVRFGEGPVEAVEAVFDINCGAHIRRGASTCARSSTCAGSVIRASE
jgi:hypothetical protein